MSECSSQRVQVIDSLSQLQSSEPESDIPVAARPTPMVAEHLPSPGCNVRFFREGETIFTEGSRSDTAYIIETGLVEIFVGSGDDAVQLSVLGSGDIFGEMGLIDNFPRSASARAVCPCRCITISGTQIAERIEASSPLVRLLISISLHRNRAYNNYFKALLNSSHVVLPNLAVTAKAYAKNPQHRKIVEEIKLESDLQKAVRNDELQPYYQPLFSICDNGIVGFESLLRWQCPDRGMVSPQQFISLAEETSLIVPIGDWILEQACIDLKHFQALWQVGQTEPSHLFMSINISVRQFQEPDFCDKLLALTERYQVLPKHIKLEVTERIFLDHADAVQAIDTCRAAGFEVALDDFGTGYSSLSYLERCEIDSLKIDQSFIQKICTSNRAKILVSSIIDIAKKLGLPTIAEGIETEEHRQILQEMGCDIGQGYLFSKPMPVEEVLSLLANSPRPSLGNDNPGNHGCL
ncbi:MAG: EAL domain-containing protein [Spirulina sp.]